MKKTFTHLTQEQRYHIYKLKGKMSLRKIAENLGCSPSTVSREIRRNKNKAGGYFYRIAQSLALQRQSDKPKRRVLDVAMLDCIERSLNRGFSPEQITGRCRLEGIAMVSRQSIYRVIAGTSGSANDWRVFLRRKKKNKRHKSFATAIGIPNRVDISQRPKEVESRLTLGHWEADTIVGAKHQGAIMTVVERKSRLLLAQPCKPKAKETAQALVNQLRRVKPQVKSITYDNGKEFTRHEVVNQQLQCQSYFAKPYHSWERGTNENTNGLLREFFPKKTSLLNVCDQQVQKAVWTLNNRPRKCLGFRTPWEAFSTEATNYKFNPSVALMS